MNTAANGEDTPRMQSRETTDTPGWREALVRRPKGLILGIRLSEADVQDLRWQAHDERFMRFLSGFIGVADSITPFLSDLPADALLRLLQIHWAVEKELTDFIEPTVDVDPRLRPMLYLSALGMRALHNAGTPLDRVDDLLASWTSHIEFYYPLVPAYGLMRGRAIKVELARRGKRHLGVWAAMLMWASKVESPDEEVKAILDKLRALAWRTTRQRLSRVDLSVTVADMDDDFASDITMLILSRWGEVPLDQAMIRALEGKFDIVVRAIADSVVKKTRPERRQRKIKAGVRAAHEAVSTSQAGRARLHPATMSPIARRLIDAYGQGARTKQELGQLSGVTERSVRNWLRKLKADYSQ